MIRVMNMDVITKNLFLALKNVFRDIGSAFANNQHRISLLINLYTVNEKQLNEPSQITPKGIHLIDSAKTNEQHVLW